MAGNGWCLWVARYPTTLFVIPARISAVEEDLALAFCIVEIYLIFRWNNYRLKSNFNHMGRN